MRHICDHTEFPLDVDEMFRTAVRAARPAAIAARTTLSLKSPSSLRTLHTTFRVASGGPAAPPIYGPGGKAGEVPSDLEQATGLERLQLLGEMEGLDVFDDSPLDSSRVGTKANPILVPSYVCYGLLICSAELCTENMIDLQVGERIIGCTGSPADSHDTLWFHVNKDKQSRCSECGSGQFPHPLAL